MGVDGSERREAVRKKERGRRRRRDRSADCSATRTAVAAADAHKLQRGAQPALLQDAKPGFRHVPPQPQGLHLRRRVKGKGGGVGGVLRPRRGHAVVKPADSDGAVGVAHRGEQRHEHVNGVLQAAAANPRVAVGGRRDDLRRRQRLCYWGGVVGLL